MEGFETPKGKRGKLLKRSEWIKEYVKQSEAHDKVINIFINLVPNNILCKLGEYKDVSDL